jgi:hypothetical protein
MGWQFWLGAPIAATIVAALVVWWQSRPRSVPSVHSRVRDHARFLDDLERHGARAAGQGPSGADPVEQGHSQPTPIAPGYPSAP